MATGYTFIAGPASLSVNTATRKRWDFNTAIIPEILWPGEVERWLKRLIADRVDGDQINFRMTFEEADSGGLAQGHDLVASWEQRNPALIISQGDLEVRIPGPDFPGNTVRDAGETYIWRPPQADYADLIQFFFADLDTTQPVTFFLATADEPVSIDADTGDYVAAEGSFSQAAAELVKPLNSDLYCLDTDRSSTTGILASQRQRSGVKVFLEIANTLEDLSELLPDGYTARPLLLDIPEIRIDDSFFAGAGDINFRMDNRGGEFSPDQIGRYVQLWGLSYGSQKRSLFVGKINRQNSDVIRAALTASNLPVEALQRQIPGRTVSQTSFPDSRVPGTVVPIVFGRAIRHPCPHLDSSIETSLYEAAAAGDTELFISTVSEVAVGDRLYLSFGEAEQEIVTVASIDIEEPSITVTAGISNGHFEGAAVTAADVVEDYLLGEGRWSGGNFTQVFRLYHDERALPMFTCQQMVNPVALAAGDHDFALAAHLRVQFRNWYRNYFIEFLDSNDDVVGSAIIAGYDPDDNTVAINLSAAVSFSCYRLREYRFFDGSQETPHGGYAFVRLARKYQGQIHADVQGFDETDPSEVLKESFKNSSWGAGETLDFVVEDAILDYEFEGAITTRQTLGALANEIGKFRPLRIIREREQIKLKWLADEAAVLMPEDLSAYISRPRIEHLPLERRRRSVTIRYRPDLRENETSQEIVEFVGGEGAAAEVELSFVYDGETADRVAYQESQRELSRRRQVKLAVDPRMIKSDIFPGMKIRIPNSLAGTDDTDWIVTAVRVAAERRFGITARQHRSELFSYPDDRFLPGADDSYDPPTDFSKTPPEPLKNFRAETVEVSDGDNILYECVVRFTSPMENYRKAEIHVALGSAEARFATFEDPANPGKARFDLPLELQRYRVIGYSLSENGLLQGYPVEFTVNESPIADAGDDRAVGAGASVILDGSGSSDPDHDSLVFLWEQVSGTPVTINNATSEMARFTAPSTPSSHVLKFQLTVSDGETSSTDSVTVNVSPYVYIPPPPPPVEDNAPVVTITTPNQTVDGGEEISLAATVMDEDGDLDYVNWSGSGTFGTVDSADTTWRAPASTGADQRYVLELRAYDLNGNEGSAAVTIIVRRASPPRPPGNNGSEVLANGNWRANFTIPVGSTATTREIRVNRAGTISEWASASVPAGLTGVSYTTPSESVLWVEMRLCNDNECSVSTRITRDA